MFRGSAFLDGGIRWGGSFFVDGWPDDGYGSFLVEPSKEAQRLYRRHDTPFDPEQIELDKVEAKRSKEAAKTAKRRSRYRKEGVEFDIEVRKARFAEEKGICQWCHHKITGRWHAHHIIPVAHGGKGTAENLMVLHAECHNNPLSYEILHNGMKMPACFNASRWRLHEI